MDTLHLLAATRCLQQDFVGRRLQGVVVEQGVARLHFGRHYLVVAYRHPSLGLFWEEAPKSVPKPTGPAAVLGQKLAGCRLESLEMPVADRILRLGFVQEDWIRAERSWTLMAECFGCKGALVLLDGEERIHWASRWDDLEVADARILPHAHYRPPAKARNWVSQSDVAELLHPRRCAALTPELRLAVQTLLASAGCPDFFANTPGDFYPLALVPEAKPMATRLALTWSTTTPAPPREDRRAVSQLRQRLQRRREALQADLQRWLATAGEGQRQAEALFAVPDRLATGEPLTLPEYRADGVGKIRVEVPAGKRLHTYAEELMRRAQRSKRAQQRIAEELRAVDAQEQALLAGSIPVLAKPPAATTRKVAHQPAIGQREIEGFLVLWGKNSRANEQLSFRMGKPQDIWLHVQDVQGSHVLIRRDSAQTPVPAAVLQAAAEIALQESQSQALSAEVDWTELRNVSRHPQGGPGRVVYRRFQTLRVRRPGSGHS
ncbi:MAG: NFACT RNA binding domain-containing protein [Candidatus Igneacidithiobacillus chanchocoensis]